MTGLNVDSTGPDEWPPDERLTMSSTVLLSAAEASARRRSRRSGWSGLFFVLLLLGSGMASVPGGSDSVATARGFYSDHWPVVIIAQLFGLAAAVVFAIHARALASLVSPRLSKRLRIAGLLVAASAAITALPVLALTVTATRSSDRVVAGLARASDLTDIVLFASVSLFAAVAARASGPSWVGGLAVTVALLTLARSVLLASGSTALGLVAPLAFISLVAVLSVRQLMPIRRR
jgi:hypothetical protein